MENVLRLKSKATKSIFIGSLLILIGLFISIVCLAKTLYAESTGVTIFDKLYYNVANFIYQIVGNSLWELAPIFSLNSLATLIFPAMIVLGSVMAHSGFTNFGRITAAKHNALNKKLEEELSL